MAFLHEEEDNQVHEDERNWQGAQVRHSSEPQKAHPTGKFAIVEKYSGVMLCRLASSLSTVIRQVGRQTKFRVLVFFKKIQYVIFQ